MKQQENASKLEEQQKHKADLHRRLYVWKHNTNCKSLEQKWIGKKAYAVHYKGPPWHQISEFVNVEEGIRIPSCLVCQKLTPNHVTTL